MKTMKTYFNVLVVSILFLFAKQAVADCLFEPVDGLIFANSFEADGFEEYCSIDIPIVVAAGNTTNHVYKDVAVKLRPGTASSAKRIVMHVHNLQRLPNDEPMAYLQVINANGNSRWVHLNNSGGVESGIVTISEQAEAYGGIGGGFHTLQLTIDVARLIDSTDSRFFLTNENTFRFWLNKAAYSEGASAYRVIWLGVFNNVSRLISARPRGYGPGSAPGAVDYIANNTTANRNEGKTLWDTKTLIAKPGDGNIRAKCMDCHTQSGYDLKYFGYSNESIYKRSRFHGFSDIEAKKVTRYLRNLNTPSYGRPWKAPYQPGETFVAGELTPLSELPVERWAAGAGYQGVLTEDKKMLKYVFPDTNGNGEVDQAEVDNVFQLSQINPGASYLGIKLTDIPIHLQLPDWNQWLPRIHPMDIWSDFKNVTGPERADPYGAYIFKKDAIEGGAIPAVWRMGSIMRESMKFSAEGAQRYYRATPQLGRVYAHNPRSNVFRDASKDNTGRLNVSVLANSSAPYRDEMFDEKAKLALVHWAAVKYFELFHVGKLEDKLETVIRDDPNLNGARGWGSSYASVFQIAPHKTARNARYWEGSTNTYDENDYTLLDADDQSPLDGDYASTVWYHLEAILNSGNKQLFGCCNSVDWAYSYDYYRRLGSSSGRSQAMIYVSTMINEWAERNITHTGSNIVGTRRGLNLRTATPVNAYAVGALQNSQTMPNSRVLLDLDEYSPNLYRYFLNTTIRRWMQVVTHPSFGYRYSTDSALNKLDQWPRITSTNSGWGLLSVEEYVPTEGEIRSNSHVARSFWRLLPLLQEEGVDATLLEDFKNWCKAAWPGPAGNLNDWDGQIAN